MAGPASVSSSRYSESFLCKVLRLMPSRAAALIWTRSQVWRTCWISSRSTRPTMRSYKSLASGPAALMPWRTSSVQSAVRSVPPPRGRIGRGAVWPRNCGGRCSTVSSGPGPEDHRPLDVVLQLADIPRPVVLAQEPHRLGVDAAHLAPILLGVAIEEEEHQGLDVLAALAQGGQVDRHHVEPVVQILAEPAGLDFLEEVAIGGGDDPGVDLLGVVVADPLELAFLQDAEQLDLELGRGAVDLVEEDAAGVRRLEPAGSVVDGAGERALDVAKQLAFQQAFGQGAAVDPDVGAG